MVRLFPTWVKDPGALGLLVMRIAVGIALMLHGYPKILVATSWMGAQTHLPGWLQSLSAVAEFGGGLALILGLLTPIACLGLIFNFVGALLLVHFANRDPYVSLVGGSSYELAMLYLCSSIMLLLVGPGIHSLDAFIFNQKERSNNKQQAKTAAWR